MILRSSGSSSSFASTAAPTPVSAEKAAEKAAEMGAAEKAAAEKVVADAAAVMEKAAAAVMEKAAAVMEKAAAEFERQFAKARAAQEAPTNAALQFGQQFEQTTPMLVMPFSVFKAQGRIMKSTKVWRDGALAAGSLVEHKEGSGKVVIFVSHTWWDRGFKDATNDPNDKYDQGAPDFQANYPEEQRKNEDGEMVTYQRPKDLKWRVICAGVQRLIEQEGLKEKDVS
eukprot:scaffold81041_cov40-Phaeocystis_antarctica.AAC.1